MTQPIDINNRRAILTVGKQARADLKGQKPLIIWMTGLSGAGKSTIAKKVEERLSGCGYHTMLLDGDNLRLGLNKDLTFTNVDRSENIRRTAEVAKLMLDAGLIVICSLISPFRRERMLARQLVDVDEFVEVFVDAPLNVCIRRDPKGLYARALAGQILNFTGLSSPYEPPEAPEIHLQTDRHEVEVLAEQILTVLRNRGNIARLE